MKLNTLSSQVTVLSTVAYHKDPSVQIWNKLHVNLTQQQLHMATMQAFYVLAQPSFQRLKHHTKGDHQQEVVMASMAETAVSIALGISNDVGDYNEGDLDGNIEVRYSSLENGGLLCRPTDKLHRPFIFVTGEGSSFTIHGFEIGTNVEKRGRSVGSDQWACWVLDRDDLLPIGGILSEYYRQRGNIMFSGT